MTRKLYDLKPYDTHFQACVQSCTIVNQQTLLILDQTLFFPEEGGQCADQGTINGIDVTAVMIADEIITHTLKGIHHFAVGEQVEGIIDWPMRFSNMQNHSAEHIFSGIVHQRYGYDNVGFHLGLEEVTVDFNGVIPERDLLDIEQAVNEAIYQNVPITAAYYTHEEAAKLSYRSKKDIPGAIRLVEIAGYDLCACCAPHVRQSGEIGLFKILRCDNYKQGVRCSILAGRRALQYLQVDFCHLTSLYQLLSANQTSIVTHVNRIYQENGMLKKQLREAETKMLMKEIENLAGPQAFLFEESLDASTMRQAVNTMMEKMETAGIFTGDDEQGYRYIIASHQDARLYGIQLKALGGKGGGKPDMIQGMVKASHKDILEALMKV